MTGLFIGVDAGGSHTEAVAMDDAGAVLARQRGPAANVSLANAPGAAGVIAEVISRVTSGPATAICVGAAGAGRAEERTALERALAERVSGVTVRVTTDGEIAIESAFPGQAGMVLMAGTGSVVFARDDGGKLYRAGGLGWQLGDEGSGYALGRATLAIAGRALDGRGRPTSLSDAVLGAAGVTDLDGLIRWAVTATKADVAALAGVACDAATRGDAVAREMVEDAAHELLALATALFQRMPPKSVAQVALSGGLLAPASPVRASVMTGLSRALPQLSVADVAIDPALGAARMARRM